MTTTEPRDPAALLPAELRQLCNLTRSPDPAVAQAARIAVDNLATELRQRGQAAVTAQHRD